jgi:hypothetical protein
MSEGHEGADDLAGKRLALRKSVQAEEASRIAHCLAVALRRAGQNDSEATRIAKELRIFSVEQKEKAVGRIESRLTTRNTGHPLLEGRKPNCLFLDESGTAVMGANDRVFALGGVSLHEEDIAAYIASADEIKMQFFGRTDITFHEPMMRKRDGMFRFQNNRDKQAQFESTLHKLVLDTPFVAFGVGVRKDLFKAEFVDNDSDPYLPTQVYDLAIMLILERYVDCLARNAERRYGRIHLESIGRREDAQHQAAYADLLLHGTQYKPQSEFQSWVEPGCRFSPKTHSNPSELADLVAREVFEWARSDCKISPPYWEDLKKKVYCYGDGRSGKFGIKIFPATGAEDQTLAHKIECGAQIPKN